MRPATFTPALRRAGVFPRRVPYTSQAQWDTARRSLARGVIHDGVSLGISGTFLMALTVGGGTVRAWAFGIRTLTSLELMSLMGLAAMAGWALIRSVRLLRTGWPLARGLRPLTAKEACALVTQVRADAPGLMRSLAHWEQETGIPLLQMDRVQVDHALRLGLFAAGECAHGAQAVPYGPEDAQIRLAWEGSVDQPVELAA